MVRECDVCRAFDAAPSIPVSGASSVAACKEKVQVDLLFLDDIIVLHAVYLFSRHSILVPVRSKNPDKVWDAFRTSRIAVFSKPRAIHMGEEGERNNELRVDFRADRYIEVHFQGAGAHPRILERRDGLARGIYNRRKADGRRAGR